MTNDKHINVFVPDESDFNDHGFMNGAYPPFPQRLMSPKKNTVVDAQSQGILIHLFLVLPMPARRVRPIAVPPPPGFDSSFQPNETMPTHVSAQQTHYSAQQAPASGYSQFVKLRAVAGALAGDWSSNRPLPDIPSFLMSELMNSLNTNQHPGELVNAMFQQQYQMMQQQPTYLTPAGLGSHKKTKEMDLVTFCQTNNIQSNVIDSPPVVMAGPYQQKLARHVNHLDTRLVSPYKSNNPVVAVQPTEKRRLAPTQVTSDKIFNLWRKQPEDLLSTPKKVKEEKDFQRTPRQPKPVSELTKRLQAVSLEEKQQQSAAAASVSIQTSNENFTFFNHQTPAELEQPQTDDRPFRVKIPPPPKSSPEHRLAQRQKQIDIGKNTPEYKNYIAIVPKKQRKKGHPITPDKYQDISKRNWEGQLKAWRRRLHQYDPPKDDFGSQESSTQLMTESQNDSLNTSPGSMKPDDDVSELEEGEIKEEEKSETLVLVEETVQMLVSSVLEQTTAGH